MSKEGGGENHRTSEAHDCYVRLDIRVKWVEEASRNYMTFIRQVMQSREILSREIQLGSEGTITNLRRPVP